MLPLAGQRMLAHIVNRLKTAEITGPVIIATSTQPQDDFICKFSGDSNTGCFRGSEEDVLARFWGAAEPLPVRYIVRATADNPLVWEGAVEFLGDLIRERNADYASFNQYMPTGLGLEIFTRQALEIAQREATEPKHREHVTPFIYTNRERFACVWSSPPTELEGQYRLTVDTLEDYELISTIYDRLYLPGSIIPAAQAIALLRAEPRLAAINADIHQKSWNE
jgi:spore coat polysaccharide biosynthesis protein SpsF